MNTTIDSPTPSSRLDFYRNPSTSYVYILQKSTGPVPENLLGQYSTGQYEGQYFLYVEIPKYANENRYDFLILTTNRKCVAERNKTRPGRAPVPKCVVAGFKLHLEYPNRAYSDFNNKAVLVEFFPESGKLTLWFFDIFKGYAKSLFESWVSGELSLFPTRRGIDPASLPIPGAPHDQ